MRSFASDNNSGVHPLVMEALNRANRDHAVGYGDDVWTEEAVRKIREAFTPDCEPLFVFNGTGSNAVALQLCTRPYNSIICAETAHIYVDECGAPARMTGCQIRPVATPDGKLTPELVRPYLCHFGEQHHSQPGTFYISQCTELGTVYRPDEIRALTELAHRHGMYVHMDVHAVPVCQFRQRTDFIGPVDSAQLRTLRDIKSSRLGMMLLAEMTKIRTYQLRSQLSVGSGNRTNLTACHAGRSAAFIYINMRSFRTYYRIIRTRA